MRLWNERWRLCPSDIFPFYGASLDDGRYWGRYRRSRLLHLSGQTNAPPIGVTVRPPPCAVAGRFGDADVCPRACEGVTRYAEVHAAAQFAPGSD